MAESSEAVSARSSSRRSAGVTGGRAPSGSSSCCATSVLDSEAVHVGTPAPGLASCSRPSGPSTTNSMVPRAWPPAAATAASASAAAACAAASASTAAVGAGWVAGAGAEPSEGGAGSAADADSDGTACPGAAAGGSAVGAGTDVEGSPAGADEPGAGARADDVAGGVVEVVGSTGPVCTLVARGCTGPSSPAACTRPPSVSAGTARTAASSRRRPAVCRVLSRAMHPGSTAWL
jgi:hypothetical protein